MPMCDAELENLRNVVREMHAEPCGNCALCRGVAELIRLRAENATLSAAMNAMGECDLKVMQKMHDALTAIACWDEGPEVTGGFDSPHEAKLARQALAGVTLPNRRPTAMAKIMGKWPSDETEEQVSKALEELS